MALFSADEELGKRDDDYKYSKKVPPVASWQHRKAPMRRNIKKLALGLGLIALVYIFFKNMPTNVKHPSTRPRYQPNPQVGNPERRPKDPDLGGFHGVPQPHTSSGNSLLDEKQYYDGPIKFYQLASSLHAASGSTNGVGSSNQNVVFAAANLKSAATLLPLACEMATWKRNHVHFALLGREDVSLEMLKAINSVDKGCDIIFHDARVDLAEHSTELRIQRSASAALGHIDRFIHPQAVIVDQSGIEDISFLKGFKERSATLGKTLIELPKDAAQNLMWFTRLDSWSLNAWNKVSIDIIIHAQPAASGSLIRLLTSLWKADYFSSSPPRLTVELPQKVDGPTEQFLQTFQWPPSRHRSDANKNTLTLHHRIPQRGLSTDENALRLVESFWPANPATSHILILSPHIQLSPLYFHYLKYSLLEYHYSAHAFASSVQLMGISLDLPTAYLNDTTAFSAPTKDSFLWQAPNSNAALYFGSVWTELHSLTSHSLEASRILPTPTTLNVKHVSKTYPGWLEHILTLGRVRGYTMLYPQLASDERLATVHHELYQAPEEYSYAMNPDHKPLDTSKPPTDISEEFLADIEDHLSLSHTETTLARKNLLNLFYPTSQLPKMEDLKRLTWDGQQVSSFVELSQDAVEFAKIFKREVGGCKIGEVPPQAKGGEVRELFCIGRDKEDTAVPVSNVIADTHQSIGGNNKVGEDAVPIGEDPTRPVGVQNTILGTATDDEQMARAGDQPNKNTGTFTATELGVTGKTVQTPTEGNVGEVDEWKQRHVHGQDRIPESDPWVRGS